MAETRGWKAKEWFEEIQKDKTEDDVQFFEIRFKWYTDAFRYFDRKTGEYDGSLTKHLSFSAMAKSAERENGEERYATSFIDIQNLRDVPVVFDKHCKLSVWNTETKHHDKLFEFEDGIALREFIACLFHEITFYGSPQQTKEELQEALSAEDYKWAENVKREIDRIKSEENE